jgi:transposase
MGEPQRHQVTELPAMRAHITEYQLQGVACECGAITRGVLPPEVKGNFGPQLAALVAYVTVVGRMPRRMVEGLLEQVLGLEMSLGSTQKCWEEASQAVALPCQELEEQLKDEPVLNVDETGWRRNADKRYLWALVAYLYVEPKYEEFHPRRIRSFSRGVPPRKEHSCRPAPTQGLRPTAASA